MRLNKFFAGAAALSLTLSQVGVSSAEASPGSGLLDKFRKFFSSKNKQTTNFQQDDDEKRKLIDSDDVNEEENFDDSLKSNKKIKVNIGNKVKAFKNLPKYNDSSLLNSEDKEKNNIKNLVTDKANEFFKGVHSVPNSNKGDEGNQLKENGGEKEIRILNSNDKIKEEQNSIFAKEEKNLENKKEKIQNKKLEEDGGTQEVKILTDDNSVKEEQKGGMKSKDKKPEVSADEKLNFDDDIENTKLKQGEIENGLDNNLKMTEEKTLKIVEDWTGEPSFVINYGEERIVSKGVIKYNDILGWNHRNSEVKKIEKVEKYEDIYTLNGNLDLDMMEDVTSLSEEHKESVCNIISSFIRVSLCKMLCQSRNNNWHEGKVYLVSEESYTRDMVTSLEKLFAVLNVIQKKCKRKSQWLECAEIIFLDLHRRMKFTTELEHCFNSLQLDDQTS